MAQKHGFKPPSSLVPLCKQCFPLKQVHRGRRKGQSLAQNPGEETFLVTNLGLKSKRHPLVATGAASGSPSLPVPLPYPHSPSRSLPTFRVPRPAPLPQPTWRSAQVAVRWSVTPGTGSREGGADARGGDCAGGRGRSAERGGAQQAERRERGGSDMDRGEQGRRRLAPGWRACGASEPRLSDPDPVQFGGRAPGASERARRGRRGAAPPKRECERVYSGVPEPSVRDRVRVCGEEKGGREGPRRCSEARREGHLRQRAGLGGHPQILEVMAFRWDRDL